jgi:hypothetical protein
MSVKVDGNKVRLFATKAIAQNAARSIGWPVGCVSSVRTNFWRGYALGVGPQLDPVGGPFLSRERFSELWSARNPAQQWTLEGHSGLHTGASGRAVQLTEDQP